MQYWNIKLNGKWYEGITDKLVEDYEGEQNAWYNTQHKMYDIKFGYNPKEIGCFTNLKSEINRIIKISRQNKTQIKNLQVVQIKED